MEKKNIDWENIGFGYQPTDYRFEARWKDGKWDEGKLVTNPNIELSEAACVLHYAQCCFEGLKAYTEKNGDIVTFRPDQNGKRMQDSAKRLEMPTFPVDKFVDAVKAVVKANAAWVPPHGTGATLYIRPVMIGSGPQIGVAPADEFIFRIFVMPVGAYFKGAVKPLKLTVSNYDRAAPHGTGGIKAGLNYAMSLYPTMEAHRHGYAENVYLDPATRTFIEETGGTNIIFVDKEGTIVVPQSPSILPSITRRSLVDVAKDLGMKVVERPVKLDEVKDMAECALCGTAAVLAPVGMIHTEEGDIYLPSGMDEMGPVSKKLRETLTGIQGGDLPDTRGWICKAW
ncbi:MAG: branched-chain amino acid aminotransferase [Burkholderiales bacterium]|nr:branched-chain amino acid aminotransferase [Burkholderiales bacterium]